MWRCIGPAPTYGACYSVGILSYFVIAWLIAKRLGLRRRVWIALGVCYLLSMTLGAKVLFDIQHGGFSLRALLTAEHYTRGGMWGGPLAYLALAVPVAWLLARRKPAAVDLVALSLPVPLLFAKLGCLFNGCCYGKPSSMPWAITFPEGAGVPAGVPLHPTQVYEMLVLVGVLVVFRLLDDRRWRGTMLLWFLAVYGLGRAATEIWRGDLHERAAAGPVSISQLICVIVGGISVLVLYWLRRRALPGEQEEVQAAP